MKNQVNARFWLSCLVLGMHLDRENTKIQKSDPQDCEVKPRSLTQSEGTGSSL